MIDTNDLPNPDQRSKAPSKPMQETNGSAEPHAWETDKPANAERTGGQPNMHGVDTGRKTK